MGEVPNELGEGLLNPFCCVSSFNGVTVYEFALVLKKGTNTGSTGCVDVVNLREHERHRSARGKTPCW